MQQRRHTGQQQKAAADEVGEKAYVTSREYTTDVYRLYDKTRGEHIYTANEVEKAALLEAGWVDEGVVYGQAKKLKIEKVPGESNRPGPYVIELRLIWDSYSVSESSFWLL